MTDHPCAGMTKRQIEAFERIAVNIDTQRDHHPKVIKALMDRQLIQRHERVMGCVSCAPIITLEYSVPFSVHQQWCQWCAENYTDQEVE